MHVEKLGILVLMIWVLNCYSFLGDLCNDNIDNYATSVDNGVRYSDGVGLVKVHDEKENHQNVENTEFQKMDVIILENLPVHELRILATGDILPENSTQMEGPVFLESRNSPNNSEK